MKVDRTRYRGGARTTITTWEPGMHRAEPGITLDLPESFFRGEGKVEDAPATESPRRKP